MKQTTMTYQRPITTIAIALLLTVTGTASAVPTIYTDESSFTTALGSAALTTDSFEDLVSNTAPPLNRGNYSLSTNFDIDASSSVVSDGTRSLAIQEDTDAFALFSFNAPIHAFSIDILDALDNGTNGGKLLVSIDGIERTFFTSTTDLANHNQLFLGILSTTGFSSVKVRGDTGGSDDVLRLDRLRYSDIPEPSAFWLLGFGLFGMLATGKLRRS